MVDSAVIMAGGAGKRLWPLSTSRKPKYLIDPGSGSSLLRSTLVRVAEVTTGNIIIITHHHHTTAVMEALEEFERALCNRITVIEEPQGRNTAPAIAWATAYLLHLCTDHTAHSTTLCVPADHLIEPLSQFKLVIAEAKKLITDYDTVVTIGVPPTRAETGYGYIEAAAAIGGGYRVARFHEKPESARAQRYLESGKFYWNSGMFAFSNRRMWDELSTHASELTAPIEALPDSVFDTVRHKNGVTLLPVRDTLTHLYTTIPSISIDYAVAERSSRMAVVPARFDWNDIGCWDELAALQDSLRSSHSSAHTTTVAINSTNNSVIGERRVALCGVDNLIVVTHNNDVLICRRGESQAVKEVVEELERRAEL